MAWRSLVGHCRLDRRVQGVRRGIGTNGAGAVGPPIGTFRERPAAALRCRGRPVGDGTHYRRGRNPFPGRRGRRGHAGRSADTSTSLSTTSRSEGTRIHRGLSGMHCGDRRHSVPTTYGGVPYENTGTDGDHRRGQETIDRADSSISNGSGRGGRNCPWTECGSRRTRRLARRRRRHGGGTGGVERRTPERRSCSGSRPTHGPGRRLVPVVATALREADHRGPGETSGYSPGGGRSLCCRPEHHTQTSRPTTWSAACGDARSLQQIEASSRVAPRNAPRRPGHAGPAHSPGSQGTTRTAS
jgi:hypothetical protein